MVFDFYDILLYLYAKSKRNKRDESELNLLVFRKKKIFINVMGFFRHFINKDTNLG